MRRQISVVFLIIFTFLWTFSAGQDDTKVSCVFMRTCLLPCSYHSGIEVLHWVKEPDTKVHSYYYNTDQLALQDDSFKGRTSLLGDPISGNATLQLKEVEVRDEGRYDCYTRKNQDSKHSYINLKVDAPVDKVNIDEEENRIFCSSEGIYPEPKLTWSIRPSSTETEQNKTTVLQNEQKLYTINSSIPLDNVTDVKYSCDISTRNSWRRATLVKSVSDARSHTETTILCAAPHAPLTSVVWRYNRTHIIVKQNGQVSEDWSQKVKVSTSRSLTLKNLTSDQEGTFTCEVTNDKETHKHNIFLRIEEKEKSPRNHWIIAVVAVLVIAVIVVVVVVVVKKKYKKCNKNDQTGPQTPEGDTSNTNQEGQTTPLNPETRDGVQSEPVTQNVKEKTEAPTEECTSQEQGEQKKEK